MRYALIAAVLALSFSAVDSEARTRRAVKQCKKVISVTSGGFIYKQSAPLRAGGVGTRLIGYRKEPTLIGVTQTLSRGGTTILDTKGNRIASCPWADAHDTRGGRFRCTISTTTVRRAAIRKTGNARIIFTNGSKPCVEVPDAGRCNGSVKGLCTQLIK